MKLVFAEGAWEDYLYWQHQDKQMIQRINKLIREIQQEPFSGIGKSEPLKHAVVVIGLGESMMSTGLCIRLKWKVC